MKSTKQDPKGPSSPQMFCDGGRRDVTSIRDISLLLLICVCVWKEAAVSVLPGLFQLGCSALLSRADSEASEILVQFERSRETIGTISFHSQSVHRKKSHTGDSVVACLRFHLAPKAQSLMRFLNTRPPCLLFENIFSRHSTCTVENLRNSPARPLS